MVIWMCKVDRSGITSEPINLILNPLNKTVSASMIATDVREVDVSIANTLVIF